MKSDGSHKRATFSLSLREIAIFFSLLLAYAYVVDRFPVWIVVVLSALWVLTLVILAARIAGRLSVPGERLSRDTVCRDSIKR